MGERGRGAFRERRKEIQTLLKAGCSINQGKVKEPAEEIQFLGMKCQDAHHQIPMDTINKISVMSPQTA